MRPSQFHFLSLQNSKRNQKIHTILNLHDCLLSYQPTSTANLAHLGWIGQAGWLVTFTYEFLGFQTLVNVDPWGILIHAVVVFPLSSDFLFKSRLAPCAPLL